MNKFAYILLGIIALIALATLCALPSGGLPDRPPLPSPSPGIGPDIFGQGWWVRLVIIKLVLAIAVMCILLGILAHAGFAYKKPQGE